MIDANEAADSRQMKKRKTEEVDATEEAMTQITVREYKESISY